MPRRTFLMLVAGLVAATCFAVSWLCLNSATQTLAEAQTGLKRCVQLGEQIEAERAKLDPSIFVDGRLDLAQSTIELLGTSSIELPDNLFAATLPPMPIGESGMSQALVATPATKLTIAELVDLIDHVAERDPSTFVSEVSMRKTDSQSPTDLETWDTQIGLYYLVDASSDQPAR